MAKKKVFIRDAWDHEVIPEIDFEKCDPVSLTIPDEAMSIGEILRRFTNGMTVPEYEPQFSDTDDFEAFDELLSGDFDLTTIDKVRDELNKLEAELKAQGEAKKAADEAKLSQKPDNAELDAEKSAK